MTATWPDYEVKVLDEARIIENETGKVVWVPAADVAVIRISTHLEAILPVPDKLVGLRVDLNRLRPRVIAELRRKLEAEPRPSMTTEPEQPTEPEDQPDVEPAPEPDEEPSDPHTAPLDDDDDARNLDPVDPRRREAEQRRGRSFEDEETA